jgi:hypothetical protein
MLYTFAISRKLADVNEAEAVLKKSTSKKLEYNQKARQPLTIDKFMKIVKHDSCEPFLRVAMNLSLVTLQARSECVNLKYTDIRDGYLYVIRDKTSGDSDMAFIRIKITDQIEEIISESRKDNIASPFTVHRAPKTRQRKHLDNKPHWTYVMPNYLSKAFKKALEASCPEYKGMGRSAPSFHEIRALGSKVYREMGYCKDQIRALMTHANEKTTDIYLNGGKLEDHHFIKVNAELNLSDLK